MFHVHDAEGPRLSFEAASVRAAISHLEEIEIPSDGGDLILLSEEVRRELRRKWEALPDEIKPRTFRVHWSDCCVAKRIGDRWQMVQ